MTSIVLSSNKTTLEIGESTLIVATVLPDNADNKQLLWYIASGANIAELTENGVLVAKDEGTVVVEAIARDGSKVMGQIIITINAPPAVKVTHVTITGVKDIYVGQTLTLGATVLPDNAENKKVEFTIVSGTEYATITTDGMLKGIKAGTVKVRATAADGSGKYGEVEIKISNIAVSSITLSAGSSSMLPA